MSTVKHAGTRYIVELLLVMAAYVAVVFAREHYLNGISNSLVRSLIIAAPIVPIWLVLVVVVRYYRRLDEFRRFRMLQVLAASFGVAACIITSYPFLVDLGLPPLGMSWAWGVMAACWIAGAFVQRLIDR